MIEQRFQTLYGLLWSLVRKITYLQTVKQDYGTGQVLTSSEIHTIEAIGQSPGIIVSDLAKVMVVTKGAISQTVNRLVTKGLARKYKLEGDQKQVHLALTDLGAVAFQHHAAFHRKFDTMIMEELAKMSEEEYQAYLHLLEVSNQNADHYIAELTGGE